MAKTQATSRVSKRNRRVAVVTGSRAEFGLLRGVIRAIDAHPRLELQLFVTGTHLLPPAKTSKDIEREFAITARVPMQKANRTGRAADAEALGRGITGFAREFAARQPDIVVVLGDRIEAFAAASSAAIAGMRVAHIHGGDRAEGVADESMRHAITKLAHIHFPATEVSAERIRRMGEEPQRVHIAGSPAIDGLEDIPPLDDDRYAQLGEPQIVFLLHPLGRSDHKEQELAARILRAASSAGRTLALHPNHDPGRDGIVHAIESWRKRDSAHNHVAVHLPRDEFIALLRRARVIVGNSSAGLIECAALGVPCVNIGARQAGRERTSQVIDLPNDAHDAVSALRARMEANHPAPTVHPYGDGRSGTRIASILAGLKLAEHPITKRNTY